MPVLVPVRREPVELKLLLVQVQGDALTIQHLRRLRELPRVTCARYP